MMKYNMFFTNMARRQRSTSTLNNVGLLILFLLIIVILLFFSSISPFTSTCTQTKPATANRVMDYNGPTRAGTGIETARGAAQNISLAFFYDFGCPCTDNAMEALTEVKSKYTNIEQYWHNIEEGKENIPNNHTKMIDFLDGYNVPSTIRNATPFVFIGDYYFYYYGVSVENLSVVLDIYSGHAVPLWPEWRVAWSMHIAFFYDPQDARSTPILESLLELNASWNRELGHLVIHHYPVSEEVNNLLFASYFSEFNLSRATQYTTPDQLYSAVFIGTDYLLNADATREALNLTITKHSGHNTPLHDITPDLTGGNICVAFFFSPTCGDCHKARRILEQMKGKHSDLDVKEYNIADLDNEILKQSYFEYYDVPEAKQGTLAVFIGDKYFVDPASLEDGLEGAIKDNIGGCRCPDIEPEKKFVVEKFEGFTLATVLLAGLVDGINPCAFATLIFFITYLTATGRTKKQILAIGIAFTLGVFITYLTLGLGLYGLFTTSVNEIQIISVLFYPIMGVFALLLGFYSLYDFTKARKGKKEEMKLKLPKSVKSLISRVIKHQAQLKFFTIFAVVTGVLISLFEFLCTGQVYLPIIMVVVKTVPEYQALAVLYLILYNLMFILPLVVMFVSVYFGMSSERLQAILDQNRAFFKLLTAIVFIVLGCILLWFAW